MFQTPILREEDLSVMRDEDASQGPFGKTAEELRYLNVLSSQVRLQILTELSKGERSIADLAPLLGLHRVTLRYHISALLSLGLIEVVKPEKSGRAGRPAARYRAVRNIPFEGFPPRQYQRLSLLALEALGEAVGPERARKLLRAKGKAAGRALVEGIAHRGGVREWNLDDVERLILLGAFREEGGIVEVSQRGDGELRYRAYSCPFLEVADLNPDLLCGALDRGFHEGMDETLGTRTDRLSCIAHGAPFCEFRVLWRGRKAAGESL
jgi:predicted ArsR family transcriptional regulator